MFCQYFGLEAFVEDRFHAEDEDRVQAEDEQCEDEQLEVIY